MMSWGGVNTWLFKPTQGYEEVMKISSLNLEHYVLRNRAYTVY